MTQKSRLPKTLGIAPYLPACQELDHYQQLCFNVVDAWITRMIAPATWITDQTFLLFYLYHDVRYHIISLPVSINQPFPNSFTQMATNQYAGTLMPHSTAGKATATLLLTIMLGSTDDDHHSLS